MSLPGSPFDCPPLAIIGQSGNVAQLALRRVLRAKDRDQPLVVIDYQGVAAAVLDRANSGNLYKAPLSWYDLANRRKPAAILRMRRSDGVVEAVKVLLSRCAELAGVPLSGEVIAWAAQLVWRLTDHGTCTLSALLRGAIRPESALWCRRERIASDELGRMTDLLAWMLGFPSVWCASEGNNPVDLDHLLRANGTIWLEMHGQHMERIESQFVAHMVEAALLDVLLSRARATATTSGRTGNPIVVYAFPAVTPLSFRPDATGVKHVAVFAVSTEHPLPRSARAWLDAKSDCWVLGEVGQISAGGERPWLDRDELARVRALRAGELWTRSGATGAAVTMRVRAPDQQPMLAHFHRRHCLKHRHATPVKQICSATEAAVRAEVRPIDLYGALCRPDTLLGGWLRVRTHARDSHGVDNVSIADFGTHFEHELDRLADELAADRYRSRPLRTMRIPKSDGGERVLKIACVRDQVVQAACLGLLEPLFEPRFSKFSFAYRPNRSAHHAVAYARSLIRIGHAWAVTADIRSCFDTIDHDVLLRLIAEVVGDTQLLGLLQRWLATDALDFHGIVPTELGVPQGGALSPLLANAYLDPLDREFEQAGVAFARYADDFFVACRTKTDAEAALALMTEFLGSVLHLALKPAKTQYCAIAEGVNFLGFKLDSRDLCVQQEKINRVEAAVAGDLQALADPQVRFSAKAAALHHMNALIRGFRNYFLIDDAPRILGQLRALDTTIEERARALLPVATRLELAWLARERFAPQARGEDEEARRDSSVVIGNYPDDGPIGIPDPTLAEFGGRTDALPASVTVSTAAGTVEPGLSQDADSSRDSDGVAVDGRLYVLTPGVFVTLREGQVELRRRHAVLQRVPLDSLAMLILQGRGVGISVDLTVKLGELRVPVVFAPPFGRPAAIAASFEGGHSRLRRQQILRRSDPDMLRTGTAMLAAKVGNQASVLKYFARYRKKQDATALHDELSRSAGEVRPLADLIRDLDIASPTLRNMAMGYEGRAASRYWAAIAKLIPTDLAFPGRRTRGATDPFNQAINYVYGLLYGEVWKAVVHVGLDPYAGIMHGAERDQGSLIFDLIEEFRAPFGDRLVLGMLGRGFRPQLGRHGDLRASVRRLIVSAFHRMWSRPVRWRGKMHAPLQILEQQARDLAKAFLAEGAYRPFQFRW